MEEAFAKASSIFLIASDDMPKNITLDQPHSKNAHDTLFLSMLKGPEDVNVRIMHFAVARAALISKRIITHTTPITIYIQDPSNLWIFAAPAMLDRPDCDRDVVLNCIFSVKLTSARSEHRYVLLYDDNNNITPQIAKSCGAIDVVNGPFKNLVNRDYVLPPKSHKMSIESIILRVEHPST